MLKWLSLLLLYLASSVSEKYIVYEADRVGCDYCQNNVVALVNC